MSNACAHFAEELVEGEGEAPLYLIALAVIGERERANQAAAQIDARPLGFLFLLSAAN